jgi:cytochrome oxidase Cu insertion factor (SCO1/SenC/PrrC family)
MQPHATDEKRIPARSRLTLWLILAVCAAPLIASYAVYYFLRPASHVNYGDLLEPRALPDAALTLLDGRPFRLSALKGEWVLVTVGAAACDERCRDRLVYMRQVRLAQGREAGRIERVWLLTDAATAEAALVAEHPGLIIALDPRGVIRGALPATGSPADHVYIVDPLGNLMMRFPADPDPRRMLKDVARLLRHSKWK